MLNLHNNLQFNDKLKSTAAKDKEAFSDNLWANINFFCNNFLHSTSLSFSLSLFLFSVLPYFKSNLIIFFKLNTAINRAYITYKQTHQKVVYGLGHSFPHLIAFPLISPFSPCIIHWWLLLMIVHCFSNSLSIIFNVCFFFTDFSIVFIFCS